MAVSNNPVTNRLLNKKNSAASVASSTSPTSASTTTRAVSNNPVTNRLTGKTTTKAQVIAEKYSSASKVADTAKDEEKNTAKKTTAQSIASNKGSQTTGGTFLGGWKQPEAKEKKTPTAAEVAAQQKEAEEAAKRLSYLETLDLDEQQKKIDALTAEAKKGSKLNVHAFGAYDPNNLTETEMALAEAQEAYNLAKSLQYSAKGKKALEALDLGAQRLVDTVAKYNIEARGLRSSDMPTEAERETALKGLLSKGLTMEEIEQLADYRARQLNEQEYDAKVRKMQELASRDDLLGISDMGAVAASIASIPLNLGSGAGYLDLLMQKAHNKQMGYDRPLDYKTGAMSLYGQASAARETVSQGIMDNADTELGGQVGSFLYQTGMSMADSAVVAGLGVLGLGAGGTLLLGGSAATAAAVDAKNRGGSDSQALWSGALAGAAETVFEKVSLDNLLTGKLTKNFVGGEFKKLLADVGVQGAVEGSEELFTAFANHITDRAIMGGSSVYAKSIREYMAAGMTAEEAKAKATADFAAECATSFVGGVLSGGVMGGVANAARYSYGAQGSQATRKAEAGVSGQDAATPLSEAPVGEEAVKDFASAMDKAGATAMTRLYSPEQEATAYIGGMMKAYNAGKTGADLNTVDGLGAITPAQAEGAYLAGQADAESAIENIKQEGVTNEEEVYLRGGGQRIDGARPGGEVRGVEESAGRVSQRQTQAFQPADAGASTLTYGEEVSVASLGIAGGSGTAKVRRVIGGDTAETLEAKAIAKERGLELVLFGGGNLVINREEVRACIIGKKMFVRADHHNFTSLQLTKHEVTHDKIDNGELDPKSVRKEMESTHTAKTMAEVDKLYADAYEGTGLSPDDIWVEVVCDSQGDMNIFAKTDEGNLVGEFLTETKKAANTTAKKTNPIRGPTEAKMSRETNFTEDKYFARQIDRFENLAEGGYITVGVISSGSPLNKVGIPSGKLYFDVSKIRQEMATRKDPVSADVMKQIPSVLNHPIVMTEFTDKNGDVSVNVYGELFIGTSPVVVGVMVTKTARGVVVNKVQTVHPKRNFMSDMTDDKILYLSENKKETKRWFQALGTQKLPLGGTKFGFIRSLAQNGNSVKLSEIEQAGVQYDAETESVAPSHFSRETWEQSSYVTDREKAAKSIAKTLGVTEKQAKAYIDDINSVAKLIADDRVRLDYEPNMDAGATVLKPNSEYKYKVDMSTLCAKRLLFTGTFDAIQKALPNTALDSEDIVLLRKMMQDRGLEVACGICYVESTRREIGRITQEFIERYKAAQKSGGVITRINSSGKEVPLAVKGKTFKTDKNYTPNLGELNTTDIDLVKRDHREVYDAYLAFMNARGQAKPKLLETRAEYKGEILKHFKAKSAVTARNEHGGLRLQSFSDFEVPHMIDMMQVVMDMSQVGLKSQAYTKVPAFAAVFGDTGVKINLSLIAKGSGLDSKGNLIFDDVEGIDHKEAFRLRRKYSKNVGTILVGKNDAHIIAALADPRIDFIIPFHKSSWKESLYDALGLTGYEDYTDTQNEKPIDKDRKISNFDPSEYWDFTKSGDENAQVYLEKCRADGRIPKFPQFQSYSGYWKLLIDFKMYDNNGVGSPQTVVRPQFNMTEARRVLKEYEGGHRSFPVARDVVDDFVKQYKKEHKGAKFSRDLDSEGRQLSATQAEFFKDSKVRDENGNLKRLYHGTQSFGFTVFDKTKLDDGFSIFMTDNVDVAESYSGTLRVRSTVKGGDVDYNSLSSAEVVDWYNKRYHGRDIKLMDGDDIAAAREKYQKKVTEYIARYRALATKFSEIARNFSGDYEYSDADKQFTEKVIDLLDRFDAADAASRQSKILDQLSEVRREYEKSASQVGKILAVGFSDAYELNNPLWRLEELSTPGEKVEIPSSIATYYRDIEDIRDDLYDLDKQEDGTGNYAVYANITNPLAINGNELNWDELILPKKYRQAYTEAIGHDPGEGRIYANTREIVKVAKHLGHDGVIFNDIVDVGAEAYDMYSSNVYVAFESNQVKDIDNLNPTSDPDIRFSRELDSAGRQLSEAQAAFFKDSKVRDEYGNLKVMYHGTQNVGFHVFDASMSDDNTSFFFTDSDDVAATYSGTYDTYVAKTVRTAEDMRTFLQRFGYEGYEVIEEGGKIFIEQDGDYVAGSDTAQGLYEEFCRHEGIGDDDANYKVYLNLKNPLVVDAGGRNWNNVSREFSQEVYDRYQSLAADEKAALVNLASWEELSIFRDEIRQALADTETGAPGTYDVDFAWNVRSAYEKLGGNKINMYDLFSIASDNFSDESLRELAVKQMNTRDYAKRAKEQGYDGVIFKNLVDNGHYSNGDEGASTVAIAFDSNQIKSVANEKPTSDPDIRYSRELDQEKVDKAWQNFIDKYGEIPAGENPFRQVHVPKKTGDDENVSQTIRTVMEARATPDEAIPTIKEMVADGDFSYESITDEASIGRATAEIKSKGWETALKDWAASVRAGNVSKDNTAMGWALYNNAANSGNIKQAVEILQDIAQHQRSAAQALQATRILKRLSPDGQLYGVTRSVQNLQEELIARHGDKAPDLKIDETLAQKVLTAGTQEERDEAMKEIYRDIGRQMPSTFIDKWNAWRYLAMLGNARTHVRNVVGNLGFVPVVGVKNLVAGAIESAADKVSGGKVGRTKAIVGLSKKDRALLKAAFADFPNAEVDSLGSGKYSDFANANRYIEEGRRIFNFKPLEAARRGNSNLLDKEDLWFSRPHYASALAQYCKAKGISAAQIAQDIPAVKKARAYAIKEAQKATYRDTNALSSFLSKKFNEQGDAKAVAKAANTLMAGILPFRKTPANILARGIEYSPIGLVNGIKKAVWDVQKGKTSAAEAIDNISSGLTGTGLLGLGLYLAAQGLVRGAGGGDEKEREFEELMGHQAYALELPNGTSITLDWLAPEALPFFVGVNLYEQTQGDFSEMKMDEALKAIGRVTEPMLEMSCLQSLNSVLDAVGRAEEDGIGAVLVEAATSYLTQALPTLLGQLERSSEQKRMTTYTDKNKWMSTDLQYTIGRASARIPGVDYGQIPYIDAWGRKEDNGSTAIRLLNNMLNPAYTSTVEGSDMEEDLLRLYQVAGENVLPTRAPKYFSVDGRRKNLTAEEYVQYATTRGQTAYNMLYELARDSAYKKLSGTDKVGVVKDVYEYSNAVAKAKVSTYEPDGWIEKAMDGEVSATDYILFNATTSDIVADKDANGNTISGSKKTKTLAAIDAMDLTKAEKDSLYFACGYAESTLYEAPWHR